MSPLCAVTAGRPPTLRELLALSVPVMLSNATVPLVGFVDAAVIGQLGSAALIGGVAMASTVFNAIYWLFAFLRMATTGFVAQAEGARDDREVAATLARALLVAMVSGFVVIVLQVPIRDAFLAFLGGSSAVQDAVRTYYGWRIWATPAGLVNFVLLGWFIGLGRTLTAFYVQIALNLVNIALALVLTLGLGWSVTGVAVAALVAEWAAAIGGLLVVMAELGRRGQRLVLADALDARRHLAAFAVNRDIMIRTACVLGAAQVFVMQGARQGDVVLAANAALTSLLFITYYLLDGYANVAETLVGQAIGARDRRQLDAAVRLILVVAGATGLVVSLAIWLAAPAIVGFMTPNAAVRATAAAYLPWAAVMPFVAVWCFVYDGIYIGATRTTDMRNMMVASFALYLALVALLVPMFGSHGLWAAYLAFFAVRGATLHWRYPALAAQAGPHR